MVVVPKSIGRHPLGPPGVNILPPLSVHVEIVENRLRFATDTLQQPDSAISELSGSDSEGYRTKVRKVHTPQAQVPYENIFGHHRPLPDSPLSRQPQNPDLKPWPRLLKCIAASAAGEIPIFLPGQGGWSPASGRVLDYLYRCNAFGLAR